MEQCFLAICLPHPGHLSLFTAESWLAPQNGQRGLYVNKVPPVDLFSGSA